MADSNFVQRRLINHHLLNNPFANPAEVVAWLGAVQSQEYHGAKWGLAQRMIRQQAASTAGDPSTSSGDRGSARLQPVTDAAIDAAFDAGKIIRTHILRPTWHFVAPADLRWMLSLTAPRVHAANAHYYRMHGIDRSAVAHSNDTLAKALEGGQQLTRNELFDALQQAGVIREGDDRLRQTLLIMRAELDGVICSGGRRGKQHTYALLDERVPPTPPLGRAEALRELTRRYFTSHGPATIQDFAWWSGLLVADVQTGINLLEGEIVEEVIDDRSYWSIPQPGANPQPELELSSPLAHLLWAYDEYTVAYKDHSAILDIKDADRLVAAFDTVVLIDGRIAGAWKRTLQKNIVTVAVTAFREWTPDEKDAVTQAAQRFSEFLGVELVLEEAL